MHSPVWEYVNKVCFQSSKEGLSWKSSACFHCWWPTLCLLYSWRWRRGGRDTSNGPKPGGHHVEALVRSSAEPVLCVSILQGHFYWWHDCLTTASNLLGVIKSRNMAEEVARKLSGGWSDMSTSTSAQVLTLQSNHSILVHLLSKQYGSDTFSCPIKENTTNIIQSPTDFKGAHVYRSTESQQAWKRWQVILMQEQEVLPKHSDRFWFWNLRKSLCWCWEWINSLRILQAVGWAPFPKQSLMMYRNPI